VDRGWISQEIKAPFGGERGLGGWGGELIDHNHPFARVKKAV